MIKRAVFFCFALAALTMFFVWSHSPDPLPAALLLTPLWLLVPWVDRRLGQFVDRAFLRRRYSQVDAERLFTSELQAASSEGDLRVRAERSLATIFQARAEVRFASETPLRQKIRLPWLPICGNMVGRRLSRAVSGFLL